MSSANVNRCGSPSGPPQLLPPQPNEPPPGGGGGVIGRQNRDSGYACTSPWVPVSGSPASPSLVASGSGRVGGTAPTVSAGQTHGVSLVQNHASCRSV